MQEAEIRVHAKGHVTFHNSIVPVPRLIWRRYPNLLEKMLARAMSHPRPHVPPVRRRH
jgi:hypothetical protein